jgi:hypothetical protein
VKRHQRVAHDPRRAGIDVFREGVPSVADLGVLEEMPMTLDIELEPHPIADVAGENAGAPPSCFEIAGDIDANVGGHNPLRLRRRRNPRDGQHRENIVRRTRITGSPVVASDSCISRRARTTWRCHQILAFA